MKKNLNNLIINGNSAVSGGGFYMSGASPNCTNVVMLGNYATNRGAGVFCDDDSNPIFQMLQ